MTNRLDVDYRALAERLAAALDAATAAYPRERYPDLTALLAEARDAGLLPPVAPTAGAAALPA